MPTQALANHPSQFISFRVAGYQGVLPLSVIQRVIRAVEVTPLPNAPLAVRGFINVQGQIVPVMDLRTRLAMAPKEIHPNDYMVLANTSRWLVALLVDEVHDVISLPPEQISLSDLLPDGIPSVAGASLLNDEFVLIHDLDTFLSPAEAERLDEALKAGGEHATSA